MNEPPNELNDATIPNVDLIFRPFFTTRACLAIVQNVVVAQRGRVTVGPSPLGGTRFDVTSPAALDAAASSAGGQAGMFCAAVVRLGLHRLPS